MALFDDLLAAVPDGVVKEVRIGLHWTAVVVEVDGEQRCGLASTALPPPGEYAEPDVPKAGELASFSARELAAWIYESEPPRASIGVAAINALLPRQPETWVDINAEDIIAERGSDKTVVMVGNFPFIPRLEPRVGRLMVLEQYPAPGQYPASAAPEIIPQADVVAITSMTMVNNTLPGILELCPPGALVLLMGPTTPLSPVLYGYGVDILAGTAVIDIPAVLNVISEGAKFRQVRPWGVRLVAMTRP